MNEYLIAVSVPVFASRIETYRIKAVSLKQAGILAKSTAEDSFENNYTDDEVSSFVESDLEEFGVDKSSDFEVLSINEIN